MFFSRKMSGKVKNMLQVRKAHYLEVSIKNHSIDTIYSLYVKYYFRNS